MKLLYEESPFLFSNKDKMKLLTESVLVEDKENSVFILKNVPCLVLDTWIKNKRFYPTEVVKETLESPETVEKFEKKLMLSQSNGHPKGLFVQLAEATHIVVGARIDYVESLEKNVLFCDFEILNTTKGKDLLNSIKQGVNLGTSIRGAGDTEEKPEGDLITKFVLLGVDVVGNPSSSTYTNLLEPLQIVEEELKEENIMPENEMRVPEMQVGNKTAVTTPDLPKSETTLSAEANAEMFKIQDELNLTVRNLENLKKQNEALNNLLNQKTKEMETMAQNYGNMERMLTESTKRIRDLQSNIKTLKEEHEFEILEAKKEVKEEVMKVSKEVFMEETKNAKDLADKETEDMRKDYREKSKMMAKELEETKRASDKMCKMLKEAQEVANSLMNVMHKMHKMNQPKRTVKAAGIKYL